MSCFHCDITKYVLYFLWNPIASSNSEKFPTPRFTFPQLITISGSLFVQALRMFLVIEIAGSPRTLGSVGASTQFPTNQEPIVVFSESVAGPKVSSMRKLPVLPVNTWWNSSSLLYLHFTAQSTKGADAYLYKSSSVLLGPLKHHQRFTNFEYFLNFTLPYRSENFERKAPTKTTGHKKNTTRTPCFLALVIFIDIPHAQTCSSLAPIM